MGAAAAIYRGIAADKLYQRIAVTVGYNILRLTASIK